MTVFCKVCGEGFEGHGSYEALDSHLLVRHHIGLPVAPSDARVARFTDTIGRGTRT